MRRVILAAAAVASALGIASCLGPGQDQPTSKLVWPFDAAEAKRRQAAAAAKLGVPVEKSVDLGDGVKLEMVLVPAGSFKMGSPESEVSRWSSIERPVHRVRITRSFYMGKHEVTQEVWEKVMMENPSWFKGANNPVESASWDGCQGFLKKLNALGKESGRFRLPTEAEWEWACRAGTKTRFCSGDADAGLANYAWFDANSVSTTHPVGKKEPNAWGLHDMHGNVWEWCADWYGEDYYGKSPRDDPTGPATGLDRVLRGGSWYNNAGICRSAFRPYERLPVSLVGTIGFRVVLPPSKAP